MADVEIRTTARTLRVSLGRGESLLEALEQAVRDARIDAAVLTVHGHLASGRLILGQRLYTRARYDPDRVSFDDGREMAGIGEVRTTTAGAIEVTLRCTVARERDVLLGEVVEAVVGDGAVTLLLEAANPMGRLRDHASGA